MPEDMTLWCWFMAEPRTWDGQSGACKGQTLGYMRDSHILLQGRGQGRDQSGAGEGQRPGDGTVRS